MGLGSFTFYSSPELLQENDRDKMQCHGELDCGLYTLSQKEKDYFKLEDCAQQVMIMEEAVYQSLEYQGPTLANVG